MEESASSSSSRPAAAALSASTLRELQQRAQTALAASREQAARLEADITRQLDDLAATLSEQVASEKGVAAESGELRSQVDRLTTDLTTARETWQKEQAALEAERDAVQQHAADLEAKLKASQEEWR